jgi:hypothetical protein
MAELRNPLQGVAVREIIQRRAKLIEPPPNVFGKLVDKWHEGSRTRPLLKNPAVQGGRDAIVQYWTNNKAGNKGLSAPIKTGFLHPIRLPLLNRVAVQVNRRLPSLFPRS